MRNWQDMPASKNIQDMTYGPQLPIVLGAPWSMGPKMGNRMFGASPMDYLGWKMTPPAPGAAQWQQQNMPAQLPLTPITDPGRQWPAYYPGPLSNQWNVGNAQNP